MEQSLENQLLHASLLCGMKPEGKPIYRLQLFYVANKHLKSVSHQSDFQRVLETGADVKGLWDNYSAKGSGHYTLTLKGHQVARHEVGMVQPLYEPLLVDQFRCSLTGKVERHSLNIHIAGKRAEILIDKEKFSSAKDACRFLENSTRLILPTKGESAVRVLCNLAIDYKFKIDLM